MKTIGCALSVLLVLWLFFRGAWIYPLAFLSYIGPESKSTPVVSPDGKYKAYTGMRGFMDSVRTSLHVEKIGGCKEKLDIHGIRSDIKWSPDSRRVAVMDINSAECNYVVFDVVTRVLTHHRIFMQSYHIKYPSEPPVPANLDEADWEWDGSHALAIMMPEKDKKTGDTVYKRLYTFDLTVKKSKEDLELE